MSSGRTSSAAPEPGEHRPYRARTIYLQPNVGADTLHDVADRAGKPLAVNPSRDVHVRRAFALAIPASQLVPPGMVGYDPARAIPPADPEAAKKLLPEAGYPDGLVTTLRRTAPAPAMRRLSQRRDLGDKDSGIVLHRRFG